MSQNHTIPRNLTDSLFKDFDLPEVSHIVPKNNNKLLTNIQSKYKDATDDDVLMLQLQQNSKFVPKLTQNVPSNNSSKSKSTQEQTPAPVTRAVTQTRAGRRKPAKRAEPQPKKQIDIDNQIGEIAEWAQKGAKNNSDDEQFNQAEKVGQTVQQLEIKKKIQEKLKTGFNNKGKTGGLLAKAAQIKKQNETKALNSDKPFSAERLVAVNNQRNQAKVIIQEHQKSTEVFMQNETKKAKPIIQNQQSEDDPWQKVNQNTIKQYNQAKQKRKNMNYELVICYYQNQFQFNEEDIEIEENGTKEQSKQQQPGCFQLLFACFKEEPKNSKGTFNSKLAKRIIAISKKQLSNGEEEFFVLKQIWRQLTGDPFSRYGSHWNKIGFQGRDPTTDLRSTGVLSILQWYIFIQNHTKLAKEQAQWSIENEFPLALTHIKITEKAVIRGQIWTDFQRSYNAMIISIFKKLKSTFKGGDTLGTRVQEEVKNTKKSFQKDLQIYNKQYKK